MYWHRSSIGPVTRAISEVDNNTMKMLLKNGRIIDGCGGVIEKGWLLIAADKIISLGETEAIPEDIAGQAAPERTL